MTSRQTRLHCKGVFTIEIGPLCIKIVPLQHRQVCFYAEIEFRISEIEFDQKNIEHIKLDAQQFDAHLSC